jgi:uncharacterized protein YjbJ (UPF0337 family)
MSLTNRAKAVAKNIEGKVQEALGNMTGDPKDKAEGKAKQAESQVRHAVEYMKDKVKKMRRSRTWSDK